MKLRKIIGTAVLLAVSFLCLAGMKEYHEGWLSKMHKDTLNDLESSVVLADYRSDQQAEIRSIFYQAWTQIQGTDEPDEAEKIADQARSSVKEVKTDAELTKEEEAERARQEQLKREQEKKEAERKAKQKAKREAKKKKEAARAKAAAEAAASTRAAASSGSSGGRSAGSGGSQSKGCVGNDAKNFY